MKYCNRNPLLSNFLGQVIQILHKIHAGIGLLLVLMLLPLSLYASGDSSSGKKKSQICSACHGTNGISIQKAWPNLAGQHAEYIVKQLKDLKEGKTRNNPAMSLQIGGLSSKDMEDLAAFYAALPEAKGKKKEQYQIRGEQLYKRGDPAKQVMACIACHSPSGRGNAGARFPSLAGQNALYIIEQMNAFKTGQRTNDLSNVMQELSKHLDKEDIKALAYYLEGL